MKNNKDSETINIFQLIAYIAFICICCFIIQLIGIEFILFICMWITFGCIALGLIGEYIITPWRDEIRNKNNEKK